MKKYLLTLVVFLLIQNISKSQSLTDSLIAVYKMNGNANDSTSNANNGTLIGTTPATDRFGVAGGALNFNGTTDYIDITPGNSKFKPTTFPISICAWIRYTTATQFGCGILLNDFTQNIYHGVILGISKTTNLVYISYGDGGAIGTTTRRTKTGTTDVADGQWHFVAGVIRGPMDMDVYIDCKNDNGNYSGTGGTMAYDSDNGTIGKNDQYSLGGNPNDYFVGDIDEIRFYHRELTPSDIYRLFKNSNYPFPTVTLGPDETVCSGSSFLLNPTVSNVNNYLWSTTETSQNITVSIDGNYVLTVTDINGCKATDTVNINFGPSISVNIGNDTILCEGQSLDLDAGIAGANYLWQDGSIDSVFSIISSGNYSVSVTVGNCSAAIDSINVSFINPPSGGLVYDTTVCRGQAIILSVEEANSNYLWQNNSSLETFPANDSGLYWVEVTNQCGSAIDSILVNYKSCNCDIFVPNAFTPNGDFINDVFQPKFNCDFIDYDFKIFDRWGELIFQTNDPNKFWDGTFKGIIVSLNVFVWELFYKYNDGRGGAFNQIKGNVTLIR